MAELHAIPKPKQDELVAMLRELLSEAERGELRQIVAYCDYGDTFRTVASRGNDAALTVGRLYTAMYRYLVDRE